MLITIIIPVLNEAEMIGKTLKHLSSNDEVEVIVVDGGSEDNTIPLVKKMGYEVYVSPSRGRANQMNFGASLAQGEILLFLHADSLLPKDYLLRVKEISSQPGVVAGAFSLKIDGQDKGFRIIENLVDWRSQFFSLPYGDQAIFLKKTVFQEIQGFPNLPIMEDFQLMLNLRKLGKIRISPAPVITSARRWQRLGIIQTTIINQLIILGYFLKVSPIKLKRLYNLFPK